MSSERSLAKKQAVSTAQAAQRHWRQRLVIVREAWEQLACADAAFRARNGAAAAAAQADSGAQLECLVRTLQIAEASRALFPVLGCRNAEGAGGLRQRAARFLGWCGFFAAPGGALREAVEGLFEPGSAAENVRALLRTTGVVPVGGGPRFPWQAAWDGRLPFLLR